MYLWDTLPYKKAMFVGVQYRRLFVRMDVNFRELELYYKQEVAPPFDNLIEIEDMRE